jgi:primosomal protein N' (replication factor Y)
MVFHQQFKRLVCHHCMHKEPEPRVCPQCREAFVRFQGWGTEQVTELVEKRFPNLKVQRMDADTTRRKGAHGKILGSFRRGEIDLLVGTQMISKGLDFPRVSLVGIISADVSLNLPDFRAGERTYSLLTQVAGRAGRGERKGEVIIQSFSPRHYSIQMAISQNYPLFYEQELKYRKLISFPPVTRLTNLRIESENEKTGQKAAAELAGRIRGSLDKVEGLKNRLRILGPLPAPIFRIKKIYRWHITLKGPGYEGRQELLDQKSVREFIFSPPKKVKIVVDVDPLNML